MKLNLILGIGSDGSLWLEKNGGLARRVVTVSQACRRLRRGRRQVYRLMKTGRLGPMEKILGERLIDAAAAESLARNPLAAQPLPDRLSRLFPEYDAKSLNAGQDSVLIISRVLESGGREDLRWLVKRYPERRIRNFIEEEAGRLLSARARRLWSLTFRATPRPIDSWRRSDPWRRGRH